MSTDTQKTSFQFTEQMKGYISVGASAYEDGYKQGKKSKTYIMFELTIRTDDIDTFVANPEHEADASGFVKCDDFGGECPVEKGIFNLFVDHNSPNVKRMKYRLFFKDSNGNPQTFVGFKAVEDDGGLDMWRDTTTLYTTIYDGHVSESEQDAASPKAKGILHILPLDFAHQLTTFKSDGPTLVARAAAYEKFGKLFLGSLWDVYGPKWCKLD